MPDEFQRDIDPQIESVQGYRHSAIKLKFKEVRVIPELGRVYASATGTNEVVAIDETTSKITARTPGGVYPDGMAYAPDAHKLYVSDEHGGTDTVIDVHTNTVVATIRIDSAQHRAFIACEGNDKLIALDLRTRQAAHQHV